MIRSVTVFPRLSGKEVSAMMETMKQYARAFNMSAECLINNSSTSKRFLHKVQYERIKEECPTLPTGLIQCVRLFPQDSYSVQGMLQWKLSRTGI